MRRAASAVLGAWLLLASVAWADWTSLPSGTFPTQGSAGQCLVAVTDGGASAWAWTSFSGTGACAANTWASALGVNAAPTCTQPSVLQLSSTKRVVTSNVTNSTTTPATITGLTWAVSAATEYGFRCVLTSSGTATSLARFNIDGPASPTTVSFITRRFTTTSAQTLLVLQAFSAAVQTATCTSSCNTTVLPTTIEGTILNGANAGTVSLQVTSSTSGQTVTVYRGSYCEVF